MKVYSPNTEHLLTTLRTVLLEEATVPTIHYPDQNKSKKLFKKSLDNVMKGTTFNHNISSDALWYHFWSKIRYAGIKAVLATDEINRIEQSGIWNDVNALRKSSWDLDINEWRVYRATKKKTYGVKWKKSELNNSKDYKLHFINSGKDAYQLMCGIGKYTDVRFIANESKFIKTVSIARDFVTFLAKNPHKKPLHFITGTDFDYSIDHFWRTHNFFKSYVGNITALHIMMDIGFPTVKPDRKLVYMLANLNMLSTLKPGVSQGTVNKVYMKRRIWEEVVEVGVKMAKEVKSSSNPIRELDYLLVKYAQVPDHNIGITVNLQKQKGINYLLNKLKQPA